MRTTNWKLIQPIVFGLAILTSTQLTTSLNAQQEPPQAQNGALDFPQNLTQAPADAEGDDLRIRLDILEEALTSQAKSEGGLFGISWQLWLHAGSAMVGLLALLVSLQACKQVRKQREEVRQLKYRCQNLLTRIGGVEVQIEQERMLTKVQSSPISPATPTYSPIPPSLPQVSTVSAPVPQMAPEPLLGPAPITKASLISALNSGDRQSLRENSSAELNITSESENALAMGKTISTELEEVTGGGSYWLIFGQGEHWLFPTDRTLRGFAAAQPSKGLFHYEQQTIAQPQLIAPALLQKSGTRWSVKTMGRIAIP